MSTDIRECTYAEAIREATDLAMERDENVFLMGLGADDPKGVFGTTLNLHQKYGPKRVFDVPVSENALTGIALGAAVKGMRPILTHQRLDFTLVSLDQIFNNLAKWNYMFNGIHRAKVVIRMVVGRGWGQGPQHSQSLQALFAHIPGLKVVMPVTPHDAKGLLIASIEDDNPVIMIEHRWLHSCLGAVPTKYYKEPLGTARIARQGKDLTVVATSYMVLEALRASEFLSKVGVDLEVIDLRTIKPFDTEMIKTSLQKTGGLIACDTGHRMCGVASEIVAHFSETMFEELKYPPTRVANPDGPTPTSRALAEHYYPRAFDIFSTAIRLLGVTDTNKVQGVMKELEERENEMPSDVPDRNFRGPF